MSCKLMPHQRFGLEWLMNREASRHRGGILADDVGLGKTIQALALILSRRPAAAASAASAEGKGPTLIVVPLSLLKQWEDEINGKIKKEHKLNILVYHGAAIRKKSVFHRGHSNQYDVVLTTYDTLAAEWRKKKVAEGEKKKEAAGNSSMKGAAAPTILNLFSPDAHFHRVILDEAQLIKNPDTQRSQAAMELEADFRLCLTGTPLMNNTDELYPLLRFLRVKPYVTKSVFEDKIGKPLRRLLPTEVDNSSGRESDSALDKVRELLNEVLLRRMKTDRIKGRPIVDIPERREKDQSVSFSEGERELYNLIRDNYKSLVDERNNGLVKNIRLKQMCLHPGLLPFDLLVSLKAIAGKDGRAILPALGKLQSGNSKKNDSIPKEMSEYRSAKIDSAMGLIESILRADDTAKIIVFSEYTTFLDVFEGFVRAKRDEFRKSKTTSTRINYGRYDGQNTPDERDRAVDHFGHEGNLLLMSLTAGGYGLNLHWATHVVLMEPVYNPYVEEQAIGRAHRVGQTRQLVVYRLFVEGTVEDNIRDMQQSKKALVKRVLGDNKVSFDRGEIVPSSYWYGKMKRGIQR